MHRPGANDIQRRVPAIPVDAVKQVQQPRDSVIKFVRFQPGTVDDLFHADNPSKDSDGLNRKSVGEWAGGSARRSRAAQPVDAVCGPGPGWSGGRVEGDLLAGEAFEFADQLTGSALGVQAVVEVGAEVDEAGVRV